MLDFLSRLENCMKGHTVQVVSVHYYMVQSRKWTLNFECKKCMQITCAFLGANANYTHQQTSFGFWLVALCYAEKELGYMDLLGEQDGQ